MRQSRLGCLALLAALAPPLVSSAAEPSGRAEQIVPMRFDPVLAPFPIVQVRVNGQAPVPFLVDTGFDGQLLIDKKAAEQLKLSARGTEVVVQPGNVRFTEILLDSVHLAGGKKEVDLGLRTAHVGDLSGLQRGFDEPPAGVIGAQALRRRIVRLDFAFHTLALLEKAEPPSTDAGVSFALREKNDAYWASFPLAEGVSAELHVDTGSNFSTVPDAVAAQLRPSATASFIHSDAYDELHVSQKLLLASLQVGPFALPDVALSAGASTDALLGTDILSRFRVTLDLKGKRLILERPGARAPLLGATGLHLVRREGEREGFLVSFVDEGSPAAKAGVRVGDRLLVVDGHRFDCLPSIVAQRLLAGLAGTVLQLKIERGRERLSVELRRPSEFDLPPGALTGLRLDKMPDTPARVVAVGPGSPGEKAGLTPGDTILTINDADTAHFQSGQLGYQLAQPEVTVTVRREGEPQPLTFRLKADAARRAK